MTTRAQTPETTAADRPASTPASSSTSPRRAAITRGLSGGFMAQEAALRPREAAPVQRQEAPGGAEQGSSAGSTLRHIGQEIVAGARDLGEAIVNPGAVIAGNRRIDLVNLETRLGDICATLGRMQTWLGRAAMGADVARLGQTSQRLRQISDGLEQVSRAAGAAEAIAQALNFAREWSEADRLWEAHRAHPTQASSRALARAMGRVISRLGGALGRLPEPVGGWAGGLLERADESFFLTAIGNLTHTNRRLTDISREDDAVLPPPNERSTHGRRGLER